jgi:putative nucleotidyltransferase with HDIG domain
MTAPNTALDRFIDSVQALPPAPHILPELLALLGQHDVDTSRLVDLITFDQALTASVLRLCNSPGLAGDERVHDLPNAITRVGLREICRLVTCVIGEGMLGAPQRGYGLARGELWRHSAAAAIAGRAIARDLGLDDALAFTAGLLHDLGKLALSAALDRARAELADQTEQARRSFLEAEELILGVNHAEVGGRLLERWRFPPALVHAVRHHHDPLLAPADVELAIVVHLEALAQLNYTERDIERLVLVTQSLLGGAALATAAH